MQKNHFLIILSPPPLPPHQQYCNFYSQWENRWNVSSDQSQAWGILNSRLSVEQTLPSASSALQQSSQRICKNIWMFEMVKIETIEHLMLVTLTCVSGADPGKALYTRDTPAPWAGRGSRSGASPVTWWSSSSSSWSSLSSGIWKVWLMSLCLYGDVILSW